MFEKSRRKIVVAIMSILAVLWIGTLCVIYAFSYHEMASTNREMLKEHAERYIPDNPMANEVEPMEPFHGKGPHSESNEFKLSTFYTVVADRNGNVIEIKNDDAQIYSDSELEDIAMEVLGESEDSGEVGDMFYYKTYKGGYILVSFMDNTIIHRNMTTLFRYMLIFGGVALIVLWFFAMFIAKKIMDPIEESYRKQKQFISDAGHELKTPISVISANSELLSSECGDNKWLSNIQYENRRMAALVSQLLELARTEDTKPQTEKINMSRLVTGDTLPFECVAFEKGLTLETNVEDEIEIIGNSSQLGQLVSILVDNAIQYSVDGGKVSVGLSKAKNACVLSVVNYGEPIPEEKLSHLFDRFYRVDEARSGSESHYGLGLTIAKAIVDSHQGKINVECAHGEVRFTVRIPIHKK